MIAIAENLDQGVLPAYCPVMPQRAIASVKFSGFVRNCQLMTNSVQPVRNPRNAVTAIAGVASGSMIRRKVCVGDAPSRLAASSSSFGMVSMYPLRFQIANGSAPDVSASPTPSSEFLKLNEKSPELTWTLFSMTKSGASAATDGTMSTATIASISARRAGKWKREKAYAARIPRPSDPSDTPAARPRLLNASCGSETGFDVGCSTTSTYACSDAPGGIRVSSVGREMLRGSSDMLTTQSNGKSTVKLMKMSKACSSSCLPQPARKKARLR